ncbi:hypothetical protein C8R46DRAFT_1125670 [Mycena filopes]|nr:hypothetical protein C8R46DRAFT_1125670 [Mycena filopes]
MKVEDAVDFKTQPHDVRPKGMKSESSDEKMNQIVFGVQEQNDFKAMEGVENAPKSEYPSITPKVELKVLLPADESGFEDTQGRQPHGGRSNATETKAQKIELKSERVPSPPVKVEDDIKLPFRFALPAVLQPPEHHAVDDVPRTDADHIVDNGESSRVEATNSEESAPNPLNSAAATLADDRMPTDAPGSSSSIAGGVRTRAAARRARGLPAPECQPNASALAPGGLPRRPKSSVTAQGPTPAPVRVKREVEEVDGDILNPSPPRKRARPTASTSDRAQPLTPALLAQLSKLSNPDIKIKKEKELSLESVVYRLNAIGLDSYLISLPDAIKRKTISRNWISKQYGGPPQGGCPTIDRTHFTHGMTLRFFDPIYSPHLPKNPGDPGLVFYGVCDPYEWNPEPEDVFIKIATNKWLYLGVYRTYTAKSLTPEEYTQQSTAFKHTWCTTVQRGGGGAGAGALCILLDLRRRLKHELGREPTAAEKKKALRSTDAKNVEVSVAEIDAGLSRGDGTLAVWAMKCVGYREELQRDLAGQVPSGFAR